MGEETGSPFNFREEKRDPTTESCVIMHFISLFINQDDKENHYETFKLSKKYVL